MARNPNTWTDEEEFWFGKIAHLGDKEWLSKVFGRSPSDIASKARELGLFISEEPRSAKGKVSWCNHCRRPRTRVDSDGCCKVCRILETEKRMRRRKAILMCRLNPAEIQRYMTENAERLEAADIAVARAEANRASAEVVSLEDFMAERDRERFGTESA